MTASASSCGISSMVFGVRVSKSKTHKAKKQDDLL